MIGRISRIVIVSAVVVLAGWATVAALLGDTSDTISGHVRDYAAQYPLIAVAFGVLAGHWFWPMGPAQPRDHLAQCPFCGSGAFLRSQTCGSCRETFIHAKDTP